jgi:hypothetical protein
VMGLLRRKPNASFRRSSISPSWATSSNGRSRHTRQACT